MWGFCHSALHPGLYWEALIGIATRINSETTSRALQLMHHKVEIESEDQVVQFITDCKRIYDKWIHQLPQYGEGLYQGMHQTGIQPNALAYELNQLTSDDDPNYRHWSKFHAHKGRIDDDAMLMGRDCSKFLKNDLHVRKKSIRYGRESESQIFEGFSWNDIIDAFQRYAPSEKEDQQEALPATTNGSGLVAVNGNGNAIDIDVVYEPGLDDGKLVSTYPREEQEEEIPW